MKEDILEQIMQDWLQHKGYFTQTNVRFRPDQKDVSKDKWNKYCVHSDIDLIAISPNKNAEYGPVVVVNCKSWVSGFDEGRLLREIKKKNPRATKLFKTLTDKHWGNALVKKVKKLTRTSRFTYLIAVTKLRGNGEVFSKYASFKKSIGNNPIKLLRLEETLQGLWEKVDQTPEPSEVGELIRVMKATGIKMKS